MFEDGSNIPATIARPVDENFVENARAKAELPFCARTNPVEELMMSVPNPNMTLDPPSRGYVSGTFSECACDCERVV